MDLIQQFFMGRFARVVAAVIFLGATFAVTLYLLMPRGGQYKVELGPASLSGTTPRADTESQPQVQTPLTDVATPSAVSDLPSPSKAGRPLVTIQQGGASTDALARAVASLERAGYSVSTATPLPGRRPTSLRHKPGSRDTAESVRKLLGTEDSPVEEDPTIQTDVWVVLGSG